MKMTLLGAGASVGVLMSGIIPEKYREKIVGRD